MCLCLYRYMRLGKKQIQTKEQQQKTSPLFRELTAGPLQGQPYYKLNKLDGKKSQLS